MWTFKDLYTLCFNKNAISAIIFKVWFTIIWLTLPHGGSGLSQVRERRKDLFQTSLIKFLFKLNID